MNFAQNLNYNVSVDTIEHVSFEHYSTIFLDWLKPKVFTFWPQIYSQWCHVMFRIYFFVDDLLYHYSFMCKPQQEYYKEEV